jgi:hypothetical protein
MNILYLQEILNRKEEIKVIGKTVEIDNVICNVMGIVRRGMELRIIILLYDESYEQQIGEMEAAELCYPRDAGSNRILIRNNRRIDAVNPFRSVLKVFIGDREFTVNGTEHRRLNPQDWDNILLITKFLNNGWKQSELDYKSIDMLFFAILKLEGDYDSIPDFNDDTKIRFKMGQYSTEHQVEMPVTLEVGDDYPDRLTFRDATTGSEHWIQINRVYLADMWEEAEKTFTDPRILEHMSSEKIAQARSSFEKHFAEICPRGMCFPVIEYECEEDMSVQFYSKSFLDSKPSLRNSTIGFILRPDRPTGILGLKLKAAVIQDPVPPDTMKIEAELFQYVKIVTSDDIVLM